MKTSKGTLSPGQVLPDPPGAAAEGPARAERVRDTGAAPSLSLCHNCTEGELSAPRRVRSASYIAKSKDCLRNEIEEAIRMHGVERVGLLTITIPESPPLRWSVASEWKTFMGQWHSFASHVLAPVVHSWCRQTEPQRNGNIHLHVVVVFKPGVDIRTGFDFKAVDRGDYRSVCPFLRSFWAMLREKAPLYGFGRCETIPVKSPAGCGFYMGKYLGKGHAIEGQGFRGRRVAYSSTWVRCTSMQRGWAIGGGWQFRSQCKAMVREYGAGFARWIASAGPRWAFKFMCQWEANEDERCPVWATAQVVGEALGVMKAAPEIDRVRAAFGGSAIGGAVPVVDTTPIGRALASARVRLREYMKGGEWRNGGVKVTAPRHQGELLFDPLRVVERATGISGGRANARHDRAASGIVGAPLHP